MSKLLSHAGAALLALVALAMIAPTVERLLRALIPLVLVAGAVAVALCLVWSATRRW